MNLKITDYLSNNVELVWVVDPELRTVTVYRNDVGPRVLTAKDRLTGEPALPGFRCKVAEFFVTNTPSAEPRPKRKRKK